MTSLRFSPVSDTASGMPWPSVRTWCLLPGRARSTGLGPLLDAPSRPGVGGIGRGLFGCEFLIPWLSTINPDHEEFISHFSVVIRESTAG